MWLLYDRGRDRNGGAGCARGRPVSPAGSLRCAAVAREEGLAPLGTAGHQAGFLLVDWPLPWPKDIGEVEALAPVHAAAKARGVRVQAVVPARDTHHVVLYHRGPEPGFAGYRRVTRGTSPGGTVEAALVLLENPGTDVVVGQPDPFQDSAGGGGDLLVCAHGRRDACCGRDGTLLAAELASDPAIARAGYRVGRTSHTGGHRFAPTAILLPEGTMWAFLDANTAARILRREGAVRDVLPHYRGCTGLGSPGLQALERQAFAEVGWGWLDWARHGTDDGHGRVSLHATGPDGTGVTWEGVVASTPRPVPDCGKPLADARKEQPEPVVLGWRRTA